MTTPSTFRMMRAFARTMAKWQWDKDDRRYIRTVGGLKPTHCPITAVTQSVTGDIFTPHDYELAVHRLGLPARLSYAIVQAADNIALISERLRRILLRAAGLNK